MPLLILEHRIWFSTNSWIEALLMDGQYPSGVRILTHLPFDQQGLSADNGLPASFMVGTSRSCGYSEKVLVIQALPTQSYLTAQFCFTNAPRI